MSRYRDPQAVEDLQYLETFCAILRKAQCNLLFKGWNREDYGELLERLAEWIRSEQDRIEEVPSDEHQT